MRFRAVSKQWQKKRALLDLILVGAVSAVLILLTFLLEITERILPWIRANEHWEADEFVPAAVILAVSIAFLAYRRWRDAVSEVAERRSIVSELSNSEEKYRTVFESSADSMMVVHVESDAIVQLNRRMHEELGYTREEFLALDYQDLFPSGSADLFQEIRETSLRFGKDARELTLITRDGTLREVQSITRMLTIQGEEHVLVNFRDITDRKKDEVALQESEKRFRDLFEQSNDAIFTHDAEGRILQVNAKAGEMLGYDPDVILTKTVTSFRPHGWTLTDVNPFQKVREQGHCRFDSRFQRADGAVLDVEISVRAIDGDSTIYQGIVRDISERKRIEKELRERRDHLYELVRARTSELTVLNQRLVEQDLERTRAEEELRKSERQYSELFDSLHEGVGLVDIEENILFCNPAYAKIFEEESAEILTGKNLKNYIVPSELPLVDEETARRQDGESALYEIDIVTAKGRRRTILVSATPKYDENNRVVGSFGAVVDLTDMKRLQDLTSRAMRLETAGRVASQVAHDFNNLLGPIVAYPGLMREELPEDHPVLSYLEAIESSAQQIAEINQELLTLGRRGHYNLTPLNLNDLVLQEIKRIQPLPETLVLQLNLEGNLDNIKGGASQISRAVLNLVTNAIDAMSGDGRLAITTRRFDTASQPAKVDGLEDGEYVHFAIADTGPGIPEDVLPRIMEPFFSTKTANRKRGSGLGLSVVCAVVEDHGGHIDIQSKVGEGTTINMYFPATAESCDEASETAIAGGNERILVVDDDEVQRTVALRLLESLGYQVDTVDSGEKALEIVAKQPPDLLILDMIMPDGIDGTETYRRILQQVPDQKAIIISGFAESERVETVLRLGAGEFVKKPLTLATMARAVRRELDSTRGSVEAEPNADTSQS